LNPRYTAPSFAVAISTDWGGKLMIDDTCQIFAVLGQELLGWGKSRPDISQFPIFYRPQGDGYVEQCPWTQMGITSLPPGEPDMDHMRYFTEPQYEEGGTIARVSFITKLTARDARGRPKAPYINQQNLTLRKTSGSWTLVAREQGPYT
jgi:hypothetical protein